MVRIIAIHDEQHIVICAVLDDMPERGTATLHRDPCSRVCR